MRPSIERIEGEQPIWRLLNESIELYVTANPHGLSMVTMRDIAANNTWLSSEGHPLLYLSLNQPERIVLDSWQMRDWHVTQDGEAVQLDVELMAEVAGSRLALVESLWLAPGLPVMRHWVTLRNESTQSVRVEGYHLLDLVLNHDVIQDPLHLFYVDVFAGHRRDRWEPGDLNFDTHEQLFEAGGAVRLAMGAYQQQCSWLAIRRTDRAGIVVGLEYDGAAEMRVFDAGRVAGGQHWCANGVIGQGVRLAAMPADPLNVEVPPGERWQSPAVFWAMFASDSTDDWDSATHVTHEFVERYLAPAWPDEQFPYVVFNSWGYGFNLTRDALLRCLDVAAEIGVEMFDADYGWQRALGDWVPVDKHMPMLGDLSRMVHERGMKFGVWMAFANADPGVPLLDEHPDWVAYPDDWGSFRSRALCLANPETRDWVTEQAIRLVGEYKIDYLKHDFELITPCTSPNHNHPPDPSGYHSAMGYQEVLRRLRQAHPHLLIENCQGGGRAMTFDMVKWHDASISSDGPVLSHAFSRRKALYGMSYVFPLRYCANYMEERPTDYACQSSMIGGPWILMDRASEWTAEDIASARRNVALYKQIRPLFRGGRVYHLRAPAEASCDALQVQHLGGQGVLLLFHPHSTQATPGWQLHVVLKGLDVAHSYRLHSSLGGESWRVGGALLMKEGLKRALKPGQSEVILLEQITG